MNIWFVCKIRYSKEDEKGMLRNVTETYLVNALTFTEAEARMYQEMGDMIRGEFSVTGITKSRITDVFHYEDSDIWHKCKISYALEDEGGKEKKISQQMLVAAHDVKQAYERIYESLNNMLVTFKVPEIVESPILEVFPYVSEEEKNNKVPANLKPLAEVLKEQENS